MFGGIIGDIVGSIYEFHNLKLKEFDLFTPENFFTDDTILTVASCAALLGDRDFASHYREFARRYPQSSWGPMFRDWFNVDNAGPYGSFGNGSAMRVSPIAYVAKSETELLALAKSSASVTHNHPEGIAGAQAVALAIFRGREGKSLDVTQKEIKLRFGYSFSRTIDEIRPKNRFDETCRGTVPEALACVFQSTSFEDAIRNAVSIGGDTDTIACIAGSVAESYFGIPAQIEKEAFGYLDPFLAQVVQRFRSEYPAAGNKSSR